MENMLNDELDAIAAPSAKTGATVTPAPAPAPENSNVQSWEADDDDGGKSVLKSSGANYIKVSEGQPARIAFIPGAKIVGAPVHYSQGQNKYFLCDSKPGKRSACCEKGDGDSNVSTKYLKQLACPLTTYLTPYPHRWKEHTLCTVPTLQLAEPDSDWHNTLLRQTMLLIWLRLKGLKERYGVMAGDSQGRVQIFCGGEEADDVIIYGSNGPIWPSSIKVATA